ncbi:SEC14-like protein 2 isoform X2 [Folsomia candida]|uniref:SEC14-like protein 2 isoform X2 n=1 Tax=Folsomia candida TaxID=158441 RepID=UPI000B8F2683|nr:SEC14-like protein 2 isoform X2 [Folsomia candida]
MISEKNSRRESEILNEFQKRVSDIQVDEAKCLRFLIARNFDQGKAEDMLRNHIKWQKDVNLEYLLNGWPAPRDMEDDFKFSFTGTSHNGGPVVWVPGGEWNIRHFVEQGRRDDIMKLTIRTLEYVLEQVKNHGNKPLVAIYGFEGLTYHKVSHFETSRIVYAGFQLLEQNYPEILQNVIIVNAPYPFYIAWNIISPLLSKRTSSKIRVFGPDKKKYVPVLRELCPDNAIPVSYLGINT